MPANLSQFPALFSTTRRKMPQLFLALFFLLTIGGDLALAGRHKHYHRVPVIDLNGAEELIGVIREDERVVTVSPKLHILKKTGPVCRYELSPATNEDQQENNVAQKDLPFEAKILDNALGTVEIRLREGAQIDCSDVEYRMRLVAVRCADDSAKSEPVLLKVTIQDVNNHAPEFEAPWYAFDVEEGKVTEITRLFATDRDCGHPYGKVCRYEITNALEGSPFHIDDQGVLSTVRPLNRSQSDSHILTIVAHDCGMLRSKSTLVTIHVKARCVDGIRQLPDNAIINIDQGDAPRQLMPRAEMVACAGEHACRVRSAEVQLSLAVAENPRDFSPDTLRECGLDAQKTVGLLPTAKTGAGVNETLNEEEAADSDESAEEAAADVHLFDGEASVVVPSEKLHSVIPEKFTLHFSMRSEVGTKEEQKQKQNILCETDVSGMNRHHFAVYIRHCKLELLLRREPENAAAEFRAAEWRWSDARVCDGQWHSYALVFSDLDNVQLMVDGERFNATERNPEILDDWPLHDGKQKKTKLVVGACWHGRSQQMVQFFNGHLSSMYLLTGKTESTQAIACLHRNHECLRFTAVEQLVSGESVTFNSAHSQLRLKANTLEDLSLLLQKVEYAVDARLSQDGTKTAPAIHSGTRTVHVHGHLMCLSGEENGTAVVLRSLPSFELKVRVEGAPLNPQLSISGENMVLTSAQNLKSGTALLPDLQITVTEASANESGAADASKKYKLDWCRVHLKPSRDMDLEYFSSPANLIASLNVDFVHDKQGIMLKGEETPENYARILTKVHYFNTRPESYPKRLYTVQCAMLGGKLLSNEFSVTMTIHSGHTDLDEAIVQKLESLSHKLDDLAPLASAEPTEGGAGNSLAEMEKHFEPSFDQLGSNRLQNILEMDLPRPKALLSHHGYDVGQGAVAGGAVAIVVVICVGFLLILLVIGVVKMRDAPSPKRRRSRKESMLEWDDNGMNMNLTVNPLEEVGKSNGGLQHTDGYFEDEEEHDMDIESCSEDVGDGRSDDELTEDDDEEDERQVLPLTENGRQGLEWDDDESALGPANLSKSYRV